MKSPTVLSQDSAEAKRPQLVCQRRGRRSEHEVLDTDGHHRDEGNDEEPSSRNKVQSVLLETTGNTGRVKLTKGRSGHHHDDDSGYRGLRTR